MCVWGGNTVRIGFGTPHSLEHALGVLDVLPVDKGGGGDCNVRAN